MCISQSGLPKYFDLLGSLFKNLQNPYVKIENKGKRINLSGPCCLVQCFLLYPFSKIVARVSGTSCGNFAKSNFFHNQLPFLRFLEAFDASRAVGHL